MRFAQLNAAVIALTEGLRIHVDVSAVANINTRPPATANDEVGFLRLTTWSYSLLFEAGRTSFALLLAMPPIDGNASEQQKHKATVEAVQQLRTWLHHNLGFDSERELTIRRAVSTWFINSCGATTPMDADHWERCFIRLCDDIQGLVNYCLHMLSMIMQSAEDRDQTLETWRRRLNRDWEAHRFDAFVADSAARLGISINARAFRERRLSDWRRYLESIPESEDPVPKMERLIDSEVFNHQRSTLPLSAKDLMRHLGLSPGPIVRTALDLVRAGHEAGIKGEAELIEYVRTGLGQSEQEENRCREALNSSDEQQLGQST